ncbi:hypothetical protein SAMN05661096_00412 [Marivirga sericea]|uniref:RHS repeat-associated core domain-containing protein n=1 Tax=Marivirga sericea TaxID=1028 RepID=A0A1X7I9Z2_9BACT|nr:hypothetical protein SAMN05661096_00412 [Marivirga sericea]
MAEKYHDMTPYKYWLNNPMAYTDPTGMTEVYGVDMDLGATGSVQNVFVSRSSGGEEEKKNKGGCGGAGQQPCPNGMEQEPDLMPEGALSYLDVVPSAKDRVGVGKGDDVTSEGSSLVLGQDLSEFDWLNLASAEGAIWAGATSIATNSSKPKFTSSKSWAKQVKIGTKLGRGLGVVGLGFTVINMRMNGINLSNSLDATFGVIGFFGAPGAAISGTYFIGNLVTYGVTGQTIGEHINNYYWIPSPGGIGFIPIDKKSGR